MAAANARKYCRDLCHSCCVCGFVVIFCLTILFLIAFFIFSLIFLPQEPKFTITNASLTQFNLSTATAANSGHNKLLIYKLSLNITLRNPNKKVGFYFDRVKVMANYSKKRRVSQNRRQPSSSQKIEAHDEDLALPKKKVKTLFFPKGPRPWF